MSLLLKSLFSTSVKNVQLLRSMRTSAPVATNYVKKWAFEASGHGKYGLLTDDLLNEHIPEIAEAVRRLPQEVKDERHYRMLRATQLSIEKAVLPKEQWTKVEDDVQYLQPYIDEVKAEWKEREEWEANH